MRYLTSFSVSFFSLRFVLKIKYFEMSFHLENLMNGYNRNFKRTVRQVLYKNILYVLSAWSNILKVMYISNTVT